MQTERVLIVLSRSLGSVYATTVTDSGVVPQAKHIADLAAFVTEHEPQHPRWVWDDTASWYPGLLRAGVRIERCFDLRLCHAIIRGSSLTTGSQLAQAAPNAWDSPASREVRVAASSTHSALFELDPIERDDIIASPDPLAELQLQRRAVAECSEPARIDRLLAAESAGALVATEMRFAGLPWSSLRHDALLEALLGPRPTVDAARPAKLQTVLDTVRRRLEAPDLNPDSPAELVRALGLAGIRVNSTRSSELSQFKHPAIEPLLEYKKLSRMLASNGWAWLDTWVTDGRFRPDYVPGATATGRWASSGGGALQLPKSIRGAVVADDGWKLVVADAAQLEPRILSAMSVDRGMIAAGSAGDLYAGIVARGAVESRAQAKVAMLGALYGATTGESGRLMPVLAREFPRAIEMVENAARAGERGEVVTTRLGRSSPASATTGDWNETAPVAEALRAREQSRARGRFTRNFIVQGTAAEWALCWIAGIRRRLHELNAGASLTDGPHLVFFLHDEVVVHTPADLADRVAGEISDAAAEAGRLLFGHLPAQFPVTIITVDNYGQAK